MAIEIQTVFSTVADSAYAIDLGRLADGRPLEFTDMRDAMQDMHRAWQSLVMCIREKREPGLASKEAIELAAVAIKFATDLGEGPRTRSRRDVRDEYQDDGD